MLHDMQVEKISSSVTAHVTHWLCVGCSILMALELCILAT